MKTNTPVRYNERTHEGALQAAPMRTALRRSLAAMLREDQFYEDGVSIADHNGACGRSEHPAKVAAPLLRPVKNEATPRSVGLYAQWPDCRSIRRWRRHAGDRHSAARRVV